MTKKRAARCITHHAACDCREYRYQEMETALKIISTWAATNCLIPAEVELICSEALNCLKVTR